MRLSTRGRFAITAMIDLASRQTPAPVPLQDLAVRHRISMSYLEQMFAKLRQHGLVESTRGPGGGYTLAHNADAITVADIIGAIEDSADTRPKGSLARNVGQRPGNDPGFVGCPAVHRGGLPAHGNVAELGS